MNFDRFKIGNPERDDHFIRIQQEDGDYVSRRCERWKCNGAVLEWDTRDGWYCPHCDTSYGKEE